jgi:hypothetical protein
MTDMVEMEFRDGFRWVPRYISMKMGDIEDTAIYTYVDALKVADRIELEGYVKRAQERLIAGHFRVNRYG